MINLDAQEFVGLVRIMSFGFYIRHATMLEPLLSNQVFSECLW